MQNIFETTDPIMLQRIAGAADYATENDYRLRIQVGTDRNGHTWIKWDCGQGWTAPYWTQDYRDGKYNVALSDQADGAGYGIYDSVDLAQQAAEEMFIIYPKFTFTRQPVNDGNDE